MSGKKSNKLIGQVINNFEIQHVIGQGGMGIVYRAYHPDLQRYSAIKVMKSELAGQSGFYERFLQEARTAARLEHPNIVDVINFGRYESSFYLMMDYIEGPSLRELIQESDGGLSLWDTVQIFWQIADVLVYSHAAGVLHRDLKPDNILLTHSVRPNRPYRAIVTDFGLVKLGQGSLLETQEGISLGTPAYMSPEQLQGAGVDGRTDIYSLGVMLYETVTGQRPYPIRSVFDAAKFHNIGKLVSPRALNPNLNLELDELIREMLVSDADHRLATAADATDRLQELVIEIGEKNHDEAASDQIKERISERGSHSVEEPSPSHSRSTPTLSPAVSIKEQYFVQVAIEDSWEEKAYPLGPKSTIVGRLTTSDIVLNHPEQRYVSKRHCEIIVRDGRVLVQDLGSTNGTLLGQNKLKPQAFYHWLPGVAVRLGPFTLTLKTGQDLSNIPSPPAEVQSKLPITKVHAGLKISCPSGVPSRLPLTADHPITIGRAVDCDMVLNHPHVSKQHCRIQLGEGGAEIVDLRSTNGTIYHEQRLPPHVAVPWIDEPAIKVGPFEIVLEDKSQDQ
jgi:serine/threonine protein kinase